MPAKASETLTITLSVKKNAEVGLKDINLPIEVKNGTRYMIILRANITYPDITLDTD